MFFSRRDVLVGLGVAGSAVALGAGARHAEDADASTALTIAPGTRFATCTLVRVDEQARGAVPIVLADADGRAFVVEAMRFDPSLEGVARAGSLALYLSNGGGGSAATDEAQGIAVMALAAEIARRQAAGMRVPSLATMSERGERRGDAPNV